MMPELFRIPLPHGNSLPIYSYGLLLVIGFYASLQVCRALARRSGIDPEVFVTCGMIALLTGLLGARLSHVLENLGQYTDPRRSAWANFLDAVNFRSGGLTFYGGMILATFCCIAYGLWKRVPVRLGMDIVAPALMVGLAFGRVGCFLNGCCYGAECDVPWAVQYPYSSNTYVDEFEAGHRAAPSGLVLRFNQPYPDPKVVPPAAPQPALPDTALLSRNDFDLVKSLQQQLASGADANALIQHLVAQQHRSKGQATALVDHAEYLRQSAAVTGRDTDLRALAGSERSHEVHPAQLYSTFNAFLIAAVCVAFFTLPHAPGRVFALMLILDGGTRYILEMLRAEPPVVTIAHYGLSFSMVLGALLVVAGAVLWFVFGKLAERWAEPHGFPVAPAPRAAVA